MSQLFFVGDVVRYVGSSKPYQHGKKHIIREASYKGNGDFEYATTKGAWFTSDDFHLVRRANASSFAKLDKHYELDT